MAADSGKPGAEAEDVPLCRIIRSLAYTLYWPLFLLAIADSTMLPTLPVFARTLVDSDSLVGVILCAREVGMITGSVPCGLFLSRFGVRMAYVTGLALMATSAALVSLSNSFETIVPSLLLGGFGSIMVVLCRMDFVKSEVKSHQRGRAISLLGGCYRAAAVVGPLCGG